MKDDTTRQWLTVVDVGYKPVKYDGRLGPFTFRGSHNYYMIAEGPMPLDVAKIIQAEMGSVCRADGDGACRGPDVWVNWYTTGGKRFANKFYGADKRDGEAEWDDLSGIERPIFVLDPSKEPGAIGFIDHYHIDTMEGLKYFCDMIRKYGLDTRPAPEWWDRR